MQVDVEEVLAGRSGRSMRRQQMGALAVAFLLHALVVTAAFAVPRLARHDRELPEYVEVHVLPASALRVQPPRPAPTPPPKPREPEPEPSPPPPKPPDPEIPALPQEEPKAKPAPVPETETPQRGSAGAPFLGAQVTGPSGAVFPFDYYLEQMLGKIRQSWVRPPVEGIETTLTFQVLHNGEIAHVEIRESSGSRAFDLAALRAVRNASPLPPLPSSYREDLLTVNLIVR
jgi:protein TonB